MKEFVEKLIGRLEEEKQRLRRLPNDCIALCDREVIEIEEKAYNFCKEIVNQLAEEYKGNDNVIQFAKLLKEICCKKDADYDKAIISPKFLCDTIDALVMDFIPQNNGWISVSEKLPETNESVLCWAKSTARGGDVCFVGSYHKGFWFLQSSANTHSFPGQYKIVAWQPLPAPYQKGSYV